MKNKRNFFTIAFELTRLYGKVSNEYDMIEDVDEIGQAHFVLESIEIDLVHGGLEDEFEKHPEAFTI